MFNLVMRLRICLIYCDAICYTGSIERLNYSNYKDQTRLASRDENGRTSAVKVKDVGRFTNREKKGQKLLFIFLLSVTSFRTF